MENIVTKILGSWSMSSFFGECLKLVSAKSFYRQYWRYFDVVKADTEQLLEASFRLRHEVFCVENNYENFPGAPEGLEIDAYDERADHFLLFHKQTGQVAGTVRAVIPSNNDALFALPLQELCDHPALFKEEIVNTLCEFSRLCMASDYRQRPADGSILPAFHSDDPDKKSKDKGMSYIGRRVPYAPLGLLSVALESALNNRMLNVVVAVSQEDCKSFKEIGMSYRVLGPKLKYYGDMLPIIFNIKHFLDTMKKINWPCWEVVSDQGRLSVLADDIALSQWHDDMFDNKTTEGILTQIL